ncbi:helix-turn-helix domain-containing protein [uncultured Gemmobacter sp.]|uniref:helix-turn-helix domain-containing protein n=1 Tax=uncultured Gemmobacter sp. TaxID=1095917 RepID=UPI002597BC4E|nr:helix-turn-helix domain-containing protein [uncultured Gemmobacter sp.]
MTTPTLLTPDEAAKILTVSTKTLRRMRDEGLKFVRLRAGTIRYRQDDLDAFIEAKTTCHSAPKIRASGITTSRSGVVDFMDLAARRTLKRPKR